MMKKASVLHTQVACSSRGISTTPLAIPVLTCRCLKGESNQGSTTSRLHPKEDKPLIPSFYPRPFLTCNNFYPPTHDTTCSAGVYLRTFLKKRNAKSSMNKHTNLPWFLIFFPTAIQVLIVTCNCLPVSSSSFSQRNHMQPCFHAFPPGATRRSPILLSSLIRR